MLFSCSCLNVRIRLAKDTIEIVDSFHIGDSLSGVEIQISQLCHERKLQFGRYVHCLNCESPCLVIPASKAPSPTSSKTTSNTVSSSKAIPANTITSSKISPITVSPNTVSSPNNVSPSSKPISSSPNPVSLSTSPNIASSSNTEFSNTVPDAPVSPSTNSSNTFPSSSQLMQYQSQYIILPQMKHLDSNEEELMHIYADYSPAFRVRIQSSPPPPSDNSIPFSIISPSQIPSSCISLQKQIQKYILSEKQKSEIRIKQFKEREHRALELSMRRLWDVERRLVFSRVWHYESTNQDDSTNNQSNNHSPSAVNSFQNDDSSTKDDDSISDESNTIDHSNVQQLASIDDSNTPQHTSDDDEESTQQLGIDESNTQHTIDELNTQHSTDESNIQNTTDESNTQHTTDESNTQQYTMDHQIPISVDKSSMDDNTLEDITIENSSTPPNQTHAEQQEISIPIPMNHNVRNPSHEKDSNQPIRAPSSKNSSRRQLFGKSTKSKPTVSQSYHDSVFRFDSDLEEERDSNDEESSDDDVMDESPVKIEQEEGVPLQRRRRSNATIASSVPVNIPMVQRMRALRQ